MDGHSGEMPSESDMELYRNLREDVEEAVRKCAWASKPSAIMPPMTRAGAGTPARLDGGSMLREQSCSGKVGLINQGATCYLNSVLQSLFLVPEFRDRIYAFRFDPARHGDAKRCIPLQMQRLFARMQLSQLAAARTNALTDSFGWSRAEAFVQHDAQELMRVLFDALERAVPEHDPASPFRGELVDFLREKVPTPDAAPPPGAPPAARAHVESFLDLVLGVQGSSGVEQALSSFVTPEQLTGDNRWECAPGRRVEAEKGMVLRTLPRILTLHLRRFMFDYATGRRRKVSDPFGVPLHLDLAPFVDAEGGVEALLPQEARRGGGGGGVDLAASRYTLSAVLIHHGTAMGGHYFAYVRDPKEGRWFEFNDTNVSEIPASAMEAALHYSQTQAASLRAEGRSDGALPAEGATATAVGALRAPEAAQAEAEEAIERALVTEDGRFVSLTAEGFSASSTPTAHSRADPDPPVDAEGAADAAAPGAQPEDSEAPAPAPAVLGMRRSKLLAALPSSAYLLLYRRDDCGSGPESLDPAQGLREEVEAENSAFADLRRAFAVGRAMLDFRVFYAPSADWSEERSAKLSFHRNAPIGSLREAAHRALLAPDLPFDRSRLRRYLPTRHRMEAALDDCQTIAAAGLHPAEDLALEVRGEDEEFAPHNPHELVVRVVEWDAEIHSPTTDPSRMWLVVLADAREATVADLRGAVASRGGAAPREDEFALVLVDGIAAKALDSPDALLAGQCGVRSGDDVLLERGSAAGPSDVAAWHEDRQNKVTLCTNRVGDGVPLEYTIHVAADLRETLAEVKERAAAAVGVAASAVVAKRNAHAPQLKDLGATLRSLGFIDGGVLHLARGRQLGPGEHALGFVKYSPQEAGKVFEKLFRMACDEGEAIGAIRERVAARLGCEASCVRLRQRKGKAAGAILRADRTLRRSFPRLVDGMEVIVQVLDAPETVTESDIVVSVQRLRPPIAPLQKASIGDPQEVVLPARMSVAELRALLSARVAAEGTVVAGADDSGDGDGECVAARSRGEGDGEQEAGVEADQVVPSLEDAGASNASRGDPSPAVHFARFSVFGASAAKPSLKDVRGLQWKPCTSMEDSAPISAAPLSLRDGGWLVYRCAAEYREAARVAKARAKAGGVGDAEAKKARRSRFQMDPSFRVTSVISCCPSRARERAVVIHVASEDVPMHAGDPSGDAGAVPEGAPAAGGPASSAAVPSPRTTQGSDPRAADAGGATGSGEEQ